jgi:hypothetical protein
MLALALHRYGRTETAQRIVQSLRERAEQSRELGMYWKQRASYHWYQAPLESHALLMEVFAEVAKDAKSVEEMKIWLIKNKQTNDWKTTTATAAAVYALLSNGTNLLEATQALEIEIGNKKLNVNELKKEAGTDYFKTTFNGADVSPKMAEVTIKNPNKVIALGAMYWQYFEDLDKVKMADNTPLSLTKTLLREEATEKGKILKTITEKTPLQVGDRVKVRITLNVDRPMEYVHLKDLRAAGFEPASVLSGYQYQDGVGYYQTTRDVSTNFFFEYLPKGVFVFEYLLTVQQRGDFSGGMTTVQCFYAPEFASHTNGIRVQVK